jgi:hypothetical protein
MDIHKIKQNQDQFLALTSLHEAEFDELLVPFPIAGNNILSTRA